MQNSYQPLADALRERRVIISDRAAYQRDPAAHLAQLQSVSEKIDRLAKALPPTTDPQLKHFLDRSSFDKALVFLETM